MSIDNFSDKWIMGCNQIRPSHPSNKNFQKKKNAIQEWIFSHQKSKTNKLKDDLTIDNILTND